MKRMRQILLQGLGLIIVFILGWAYYPSLFRLRDHLQFKWEGVFQDKINFRDAGVSINACAGQQLVVEKRFFRASEFFSGWSCDRVGDPDVVLSLNYSKGLDRKYYCRASDGLRVGHVYQTEELTDLEFEDTWKSRPEFVGPACEFLRDAWQTVGDGKRVLVHCEAGRDRTGALTAILAALWIEKHTALTDQGIEAIECDYRKSVSLKSYKYGRIQNFLTQIRSDYGSVEAYIRHYCPQASHWL